MIKEKVGTLGTLDLSVPGACSDPGQVWECRWAKKAGSQLLQSCSSGVRVAVRDDDVRQDACRCAFRAAARGGTRLPGAICTSRRVFAHSRC